MLNQQFIPYEDSSSFLTYLVEERPDLDLEILPKRQLILASDEMGEKVLEFRPPLPYPVMSPEINGLEAYLELVESEIPSYVMLLMQAGAASLGYFEEGKPILHKVIKKYMTRRKQGKAQINYLNTRGKSKAGSRVRLANSVRFFEEINEYLQKWETYEPPERILYSCSARLWGLTFQSKTPPPFDKKDPRLVRIPLDVHVPDHEELLRVNRFALQGEIRYYQELE